MALFLIAGCTTLFYHPDRFQYVKPENYNFTYREITFHPKDGTELIGWFFPSKLKEVKGTIVHFHGNAQNMSAHFLGLSWVMDRGYNLFVFDYRGYGISDGKPTPEGVNQDSIAALETARKLWSENGKGLFVAYGQSLGGAALMRALKDYPQTESIDLVVQDATFMSYQDVSFHKLLRSPLFFLSPLAYVLISDEYATEKVVQNFTRPTLVIVPQKDSVIDQKFGKKIYKTLGSQKKWIWKLPNTMHISTFHDPKEPYRDRFIKLLEDLK